MGIVNSLRLARRAEITLKLPLKARSMAERVPDTRSFSMPDEVLLMLHTLEAKYGVLWLFAEAAASQLTEAKVPVEPLQPVSQLQATSPALPVEQPSLATEKVSQSRLLPPSRVSIDCRLESFLDYS